MAENQKTFNAKVVGTVDIQSGDATNIIKRLTDLQKQLTAEFKKTANEAANLHDEIGKNPNAEQIKKLKEQVVALAGELKHINTLGRSTKLLNVDDVKTANDLAKKINDIARAFHESQKQTKIEGGIFGLDSNNVKEGIKRLKELERASAAVNGAMSMKGDPTGELSKYKTRIEANTKALENHIKALRTAAELEKAHTEALKANAAFDKKIAEARARLNAEQAEAVRAKELKAIQAGQKAYQEAELDHNKKLGKIAADRAKMNEDQQLRERKSILDFLSWRQRARDKASQDEYRQIVKDQEFQYRLANSARAQGKFNRDNLDVSQVARDAGAYQFDKLFERTTNMANPVWQAQDRSRRQRLAEQQALKEIYAQAGQQPEVSGFYRARAGESENAARVEAAKRIVALQKELVDLQMTGKLNEQESLRLRSAISKAIADETQARNKAGNVQAQQNQADRNMARIGGIGGASLLAVQASLMANYAILNNVTGSIRTAIANSVDLEAAFRNVQAVTATTRTEMGGLEEKVKAVAAGTKFSSQEVADAALILGQAGLDAKQVGEAIKPVTELAAASGTNLAQAVDLVTSVVGVFDKKASDTGDIANKITQAANSSKVSVEKLALGFQYAGNTAAQMGITFEETTAAMSAMSNAGIKSGSTMGTGLRQFLVETQKPSEEFLKTIDRLGLTMADLDFKSLGLVGVARRLREAGFIASDAIKSFDVRGAAAFNALIANPDELDRQYRLLLNTKAGVEANEIQMDSLRAQGTRLTTSMTNLVFAGFEPLGKALAWVAGGFATAIQGASEYKTTVGILGTVLAGTAAAGMGLYAASLAAGALQIMGISKATIDMVRTMTAAQAITGTLTAIRTGFVALSATAATTATAVTTSMAAGTAATTVFSGAVGVLTGAFTALWTAIKGMSLLTGLGLVLGVVAGGFYLMNRSANEAKEEMDRLKAKSNEAKGAFEEKQGVISSLNSKIAELTYKQQDASTSTKDLTSVGLALQTQFGNIGYAADNTTRSYSGMISKLKELRGQMELLAEAKLKEAGRENQNLQTKATKEARSELDKISTPTTAAIDLALNEKYKGILTEGQREKLKTAKQQILAGDVTKATDVADVKPILEELARGIRTKGSTGGVASSQATRLENAARGLDGFSKANYDRMAASAEGAAIKQSLTNLQDTKTYRNSPVTVDGKTVTLEEAMGSLGGNMRAKALSRFGKNEDKLAGYDQFYDMSQGEIKQLKQIQDKLEKDMASNDPGINKDVVQQRLTETKGLVEGIKTEVRNYANETQSKADINYKKESMRLKALTGAKNKSVAANAIRDLAALDKKYKTRAIIDPEEREAQELAIIDSGDIRAQNKLDSGGAGRQTSINRVRERVLKIEEQALLRAANSDKTQAGLVSDSELSTKLLDNGIKKLGEAKMKARAAALERQAEERKNAPAEDLKGMETVWKDELRAIDMEYAEKVQSFTETFKGFGKVAGAALKKMQDALENQKQQIADTKVASEDRIYAESSTLRELELERDLGKKLRDRNFASSATYGYSTSTKEGGGPIYKMVDGKLTKVDTGLTETEGMRSNTTFGPKGVSVSATTYGGESNRSDTRVGSGTSSAFSNTRGLTSGINSASSPLTGTLKQRIAQETVRIGMIELEENKKYLDLLGDGETGLIGNITAQLKLAEAEYETTKRRKDEMEKLMKQRNLTAEESKEFAQLAGALDPQRSKVRDLQGELNSARRDRRTALKDRTDIQSKVSKNTDELPEEVTLDNLGRKLDEVWSKYKEMVADMDVMKTVGDGMSSVLGTLTGSMGNAFASMASGTKSVKGAFRDMATAVIKSMMDIAAQAVAMQAMKGIMSLFSFGGGSSTGGMNLDAGISSMPQMAATGGFVMPSGRIERVRKFAAGGPVTGGVQGRDSVPALVMPGEFILKKAAVDAVGTDYLHSLNQASNAVVSSSTPKNPDAAKQDGGVVNVWIVTPDQQPGGLGPKDVIAVISDDISRGGSVKKLIKQVSTNQI